MRQSTAVIALALVATVCFGSQDTSRDWTSVTFTVPVDRPYGTASVTAASRGDGLERRINRLVVRYDRYEVEVPNNCLKRICTPWVSSIRLSQPSGPDQSYDHVLTFEYGDPWSWDEGDAPRVTIVILKGRVTDAYVSGEFKDGGIQIAKPRKWKENCLTTP